LVAATVGVRSQCVLQGWITAFDRRFSKFSPGLILLTELAQAAEQLGIRRIDMGKGPEPFKRSFQSGSMELAEGSVDLHVMAGVLKQNWLRTREWVKTTSLATPARRLVDRVRTVRGE
jgi:CelD/BcsL family acetyltransferase involved in cellulose biosynthesis